MADQQDGSGRFGEKLFALGFRPVPRGLIECPASEEVEVLTKRECSNHHVITVSGSDEEKCWQRSVTEDELKHILEALRKILAE